MKNRGSFFEDEWRACLRAHYLHVLQVRDRIAEETLRGVLIEAGFSSAEIESWRREAGYFPIEKPE